MKSKVIVISDNEFLCRQFSHIVCNLKYNSFDFIYATSPFSNQSDFSPLETIVIDLKKNKDVEYVVANYDMAFSIHCKQIFPKDLIRKIKCVNVHPGYNPINRGWYPQVFSIINETPIGVTIHEMDEKLDHGNIIVRELVEKTNYDTSLSLYNKIIKKELDLLERWLLKILENNYQAFPPENEGNIYLKKDFNELCKIDLEESATYRECINKLRALSHGDFKNCYFLDDTTGKKIYINLKLELED